MPRSRTVRLVAAAMVAAAAAVAAAWTPVTGSPAARHPAVSWAAAAAPPLTTAVGPAASGELLGGPPVAARQSYEGDSEPWKISPTQWVRARGLGGVGGGERVLGAMSRGRASRGGHAAASARKTEGARGHAGLCTGMGPWVWEKARPGGPGDR